MTTKAIEDFKKKTITVNILYLALYAVCIIFYILFREDAFVLIITWLVNTIAAITNWIWFFYCKRKFERLRNEALGIYLLKTDIFNKINMGI